MSTYLSYVHQWVGCLMRRKWEEKKDRARFVLQQHLNNNVDFFTVIYR